MTMTELLKTLLEATAWKMEQPELFSTFHFAALLITAGAAVFFAAVLSKHFNIRILAIAGWLLVFMELYKQLFIYFIVNDGTYDWWFFPFQLCSVPMYLCILLPLTKGRLKTAFLTFMADYTFVSAAAALIYPEDMLRSYTALTVHGFLWHGILLFISLVIIMSGSAGTLRSGFNSATILFIILCFIAIAVNAAVEHFMLSGSAYSYAAMFYLNPFHISPQPLVGIVQHSLGILAGLVLYSISIIAVSGLFCAIRSNYKPLKNS